MKCKFKCNPDKEMRLGKRIELEHAHLFPKYIQKKMAKAIAKDHIKENSCYYSRGLVPMEKKLKKIKRRCK